jgi:hypothetical protein
MSLLKRSNRFTYSLMYMYCDESKPLVPCKSRYGSLPNQKWLLTYCKDAFLQIGTPWFGQCLAIVRPHSRKAVGVDLQSRLEATGGVIGNRPWFYAELQNTSIWSCQTAVLQIVCMLGCLGPAGLGIYQATCPHFNHFQTFPNQILACPSSLRAKLHWHIDSLDTPCQSG